MCLYPTEIAWLTALSTSPGFDCHVPVLNKLACPLRTKVGEEHTQTQGGDLRTGVELEASFVHSHDDSFEVMIEVRGRYIVL
jgi:hypothetical protein